LMLRAAPAASSGIEARTDPDEDSAADTVGPKRRLFSFLRG